MSKPIKSVETRKGHLTVAEREQRLQAENRIKISKNELFEVPEWLIDEVAKNEYLRIVTLLSDNELVGNLDRNAIGIYCNAFSGYQKTIKLLMDCPCDVGRETKAIMDTQCIYLDQMKKYGAMFGMDVSSRLKAAKTKINDEQEQIIDKFGSI